MSRTNVLKPFEENKVYMDKMTSEGIDRNRKGFAEIIVKDKDGRPVKEAKLHVKQKTHEFKYGANLFMLDELESDEKNELYKKYFAEAFNMATLPFYWSDLEPEKGKQRYDINSPKIYRRPATDLCMEFCEKNGIEPREHGLAYERFYPDWLVDADIDTCKKEYERRCCETAERYGSRIRTVEVTNEMFWPKGKTILYKQDDFVEYSLKTAGKYFKDNQLAVNEFAGIWNCNDDVREKYYSYIEKAINNGAKIDAVGLQFHMFFPKEAEFEKTEKYYNPIKLYDTMDLYSKFGKPLQLTEVTVPAYSNSDEDEWVQAEIIKNLYSIWFSHSNMEQIMYWNLVDGYAAFAKQGDMTAGENYYYGGLLRFDLTPKPSYYAIRDLFEKVWHTEETICTDEKGKAIFKGFYGKYEVEACADGKTVPKEFDFSKTGKATLEITL